jgi:hypothetical protein
LEKYHEKTREWRDQKVKPREFDLGNLVLLRSPKTEALECLNPSGQDHTW